jgi:hypothetical protein
LLGLGVIALADGDAREAVAEPHAARLLARLIGARGTRIVVPCGEDGAGAQARHQRGEGTGAEDPQRSAAGDRFGELA